MKTIIKHTFLGIIFFVLFSCGLFNRSDRNVNVIDNYKPTYTVIKLSDKLKFAFDQKGNDSFGQLFIEWNNLVNPNSDEFINQNDTISALFMVYREFYKPLDLLKLGKWEWGNDLNSNCQYVVVQNKIFYTTTLTDNFADFNWKNSKKDSIINFRPLINLEKKKVLYLTDEYAKAINKFLRSESSELGEGNIMSPSKALGTSKKRYDALRTYIPILHGHWGGYWHLETHPYIRIVIFNKTLTYAKIEFRVGYQGGEATLEKNGIDWHIIESKSTWIE